MRATGAPGGVATRAIATIMRPLKAPWLMGGLFVDNLVRNGSRNRLLHPPVAMIPSLHVGIFAVVARVLWSAAGTPVLRTAALAYPLAVATPVVVTGNHFPAHIAGGVAVVIPAARTSRCASRGSGTSRPPEHSGRLHEATDGIGQEPDGVRARHPGPTATSGEPARRIHVHELAFEDERAMTRPHDAAGRTPRLTQTPRTRRPQPVRS